MVTGDQDKLICQEEPFQVLRALLVLKDIEGMESCIWMIKTL
jgi:hypothetical protein